MTSLEMRQDPLFLRNSNEAIGRWNFPVIHKQSLPEGEIQLIACSDTRNNDSLNREKGVHFFVDDYRFEMLPSNIPFPFGGGKRFPPPIFNDGAEINEKMDMYPAGACAGGCLRAASAG